MGTRLNVGFSAASSSQTEGSTHPLKRKSRDIGWDYGELVMENNLEKIKCKLCDKVMCENISRLKKHVAHVRGNVAPCEKSSQIDQEKCKEALQHRNKKKVLSHFSKESERMVSYEGSMRSSLYIYDEKANEGVVPQDGQPKVPRATEMKSKPLVETDEEDNAIMIKFRRAKASVATKAVDSGATLAAGAAATEAELTGGLLTGNRELIILDPELESTINMETNAEQVQRQMNEFAPKSRKKKDQLMKQVTDLEGQIQHWKDQEASWDEMKKVLERDRDEAREEAQSAIFENYGLKMKLEKVSKEAEDARASANKFASSIPDLCIGFASAKRLRRKVADLQTQIQAWKDIKRSSNEEMKVLERDCDEGWAEAYNAILIIRDLREKLEKVSKEAEDAKACAKMAISEAAKQTEDAKKAVVSTRKSHKIGLGNYVAHLANEEGRSVGDYLNELVKEMAHDDRSPADSEFGVAGHEGDKAIIHGSP